MAIERYKRQLMLKGFGPDGQKRLLNARVLVVGAGGLGCPVLLYLAAAGVGTLGIADTDTVSLHNLHRQVMYDTKDVGSYKVKVAVEKLNEKNPELKYNAHETMLSKENAIDIISEYDVVVDATDNFASRYLLSDACFLLKKPMVYGAVSEYQGQAGIFCSPQAPYPATYRDLFPIPPLAEEVPDCNDAGVLGVLPGIVGLMQANEVIKLITESGKPLINKIVTIHLSDYRFHECEIMPLPENGTPSSVEELGTCNYSGFCNGAVSELKQLEPSEFLKIKMESNWTFVDVREPEERTESQDFPVVNLPLDRIKSEVPHLSLMENVLIFCASGQRSLIAQRIFSAHFPEKCIFSLKGGVLALERAI